MFPRKLTSGKEGGWKVKVCQKSPAKVLVNSPNLCSRMILFSREEKLPNF